MQQSVLDFWFNELKPAQWWAKSARLDAQITKRFGDLHQAAAAGELFAWRETASGRLAEIIILDQFSRHIYRDHARAFATDGMALVLSQTAIEQGVDHELTQPQKMFLYMPFMHSESLLIQNRAVTLFGQANVSNSLRIAQRHQEIIARFGRFPHRNNCLGRTSSAEEVAFLQEPNSSF